ncbi:cupin domain-containing protein [Streptomyces huasconensis]|uniref:cupin domain-containing protein n=1 Tax=Streptomyces huasconensis TaxID=1854574 RepID=UPI0036F66F4C
MPGAQTYRSGQDLVTHLFPGVSVQLVHGAGLTEMIWVFQANAHVPEHTHEAEQIVHCVEGIFEVHVAEEIVVLQAGDTVVIPAEVPHAARALTDARGIDVFHPVREDYKF